MLGKLHVHDRADDLDDVAEVFCLMLRHLWLLVSK
jgi:hypothetical protein